MEFDKSTIKSLLDQTSTLRAICIENIYLEFKDKGQGLANIDLLAENLVELNKAIRYYNQKLLDLEVKEK